jgi:hypothetical protein
MRLVEPHRPLTRSLRAGALVALTLTAGAALAAARFPAVSLQDEGEPLPPGAVITDHNEALSESAAGIRHAAELATDWLVRNQDTNGGWSRKIPEKKSEGRGSLAEGELEHTNMALTGMALLALLRRDELGPEDAAVDAAIEEAVAFILASQNPDTSVFGPQDSFAFLVGHMLATEALARASIGNMTDERERALKSAVYVIESGRNPYGAWRYSVPPQGENDSVMTGRALLALSAAFDAGVAASPEAFAMGMGYLAEVEDPETGRTHYMRDQEFAPRLAGRHKAFPAEYTEAPTAMHMRLRGLAGLDAPNPELMKRAEGVLLRRVPVWDLEHGTVDYDYWWQGTEALAARSAAGCNWTAWRISLLDALWEHEVREGEDAGTWPMVDAWSAPGLEVYASAANALSLYAVYERE